MKWKAKVDSVLRSDGKRFWVGAQSTNSDCRIGKFFSSWHGALKFALTGEMDSTYLRCLPDLA